ncbi:dihydrofolate reductase family protein [Micromonospora deserti]|uniref:Riboflavin biosynthesis protein RibD n=1 Tax=Micromonospora deserti TaxID=2070366 RepID=A0A2W2ED04_9ACTN|nr:dihydrofolate reductase family protein [Micromonospora deserti]PZG02704.1 riboflavin biosynthesis protein RibD [Micromonospora deserti]
MRNLVVSTSLTLDGVMQAPGTPEEDPSGGFTLGGWLVNHWDDAVGESMAKSTGRPFELLLGRKTYEIFAAHWPFATDDPGAEVLNQARKYVVTTTLEQAEWDNTTVLNQDAVAQVRALKEQDGPEIQVHGSGDLIQTLLRHELVDEFRLWIFPIVVGKGKRLFDAGTVPTTFAVRESSTSPNGVIMVTYERAAGGVDTGSFALETPSERELQRRERLGA